MFLYWVVFLLLITTYSSHKNDLKLHSRIQQLRISFVSLSYTKNQPVVAPSFRAANNISYVRVYYITPQYGCLYQFNY